MSKDPQDDLPTKCTSSWSTVPRVTNFDDADITDLERSAPNQQGGLRRSRSETDNDAVSDQSGCDRAEASSSPSMRSLIQSQRTVDLQGLRQCRDCRGHRTRFGCACDEERLIKMGVPEDHAWTGRNGRESSRRKFCRVSDLRGGTFTISNLGRDWRSVLDADRERS